MIASIPSRRRSPRRPELLRGLRAGGAAPLVALAANGAVVVALAGRGQTVAAAVALAPLCLVALGALVAGTRAAVLVAALALPMSLPRLTSPLPLGGGHLYLADAIAVAALAGWVAAWLVRGSRGGPARPRPRTLVLRWPYALFAAAMVAAILRGHESYGSSLIGQPFRLLLYAGIAGAVVESSPRKAYRIVVAVFYAGTVWMLLSAGYYLASGTSQTSAVDLSTGGARVLSISVSLYMAGALFLALLNLQLATDARAQVLHAAMAVLALVGVVLGYGRAVYAAVAIVLVALVVLQRRIPARALRLLPLVAPLLVVAAVALPRAAPTVLPDLVERVSASPQDDANVQWRVKANAAVLEQVRSSPLFGVGFGLGSRFVIVERGKYGVSYPFVQRIEQDPHNGFLYLAAGGGLAALAAFLALVGAFAFECVRRYRGARDPVERALLVWCAATLFVFLFNSASGTNFESPPDLLTIWTLLVLPMVVPLRRRAAPVRPRGPLDRTAPPSANGEERPCRVDPCSAADSCA